MTLREKIGVARARLVAAGIDNGEAGRDQSRTACGHELVKSHFAGSEPLDPVASLSFSAL